MTDQPRIEPLEPPYEPEVETRLAAMMLAGVPPILLFRTFAKNLPMAKAMGPWGGYELSKHLSLTLRQREIVINRTCALCRCEYEWGVHVAFFAERAQLSSEQVSSLTHGQPTDDCWTQSSDQLLIEAVDSMHGNGTIPDELYVRLASVFTEGQILDLTMLCGWYHAISFTANVAGVEREPGAPQFADCLP